MVRLEEDIQLEVVRVADEAPPLLVDAVVGVGALGRQRRPVTRRHLLARLYHLTLHHVTDGVRVGVLAWRMESFLLIK